MEREIQELQKQVYDGYKRIKELVDENQKLITKLNDITNGDVPPSSSRRER